MGLRTEVFVTRANISRPIRQCDVSANAQTEQALKPLAAVNGVSAVTAWLEVHSLEGIFIAGIRDILGVGAQAAGDINV